MTTLICVSDLHLDFRTNAVSRFDEVALGLRQAKDEAIRRNADCFICAGDLCNPDSGAIVYKVLALLIEVMMELDAAGIPTQFISGNHDGPEGESVLTPLVALAKGLKDSTVAEVGGWQEYVGFDVLSLPYGKYDAAKAVLGFSSWREGTGRRNRLAVVVSHLFPIPGIAPGSETNENPRGGPRPIPCKELAEIKGPLLVLSGHYHARQNFQPEVGPPIQIIGSLCQLSHSEETNEASFLRIEVP